MHQSTIGTKNATLGLPSLPNSIDSLVVGGVYVLIEEKASARFPVLSASLANGLDIGMKCRLLLQQNPESLIERLQSFGNLRITQAIQEHQLELFTVQDEFSNNMSRFGAEAFVKELEHFAFPDGCYIVFDQADELFVLHDALIAVDQVKVLKEWTVAHNITLLVILTRASGIPSSTIGALMNNLTGIARLGTKEHGLELSFDYWQSTEGRIAGQRCTLTQLSSGMYEATSSAAAQKVIRSEQKPGPIQRIDTQESQVFFMDSDLGGLAKQAPGNWQHIDSLDGMVRATRDLSLATCILLFQKNSELRQLAETVHTLRLSIGRRAHIVVQEKGASLRYQNEALLLKLGLNLVINRDVPMSRFPLLLQSLQGQIFNRNVDVNFEAALASVLRTQMHGYLLPTRFVLEVTAILERSENLQVPCALMIGCPASDASILGLMTGNQISRPGDLVTADTENCFVFLYACPQSEILETLERLFGLSVDIAFASIRFAVNRAEIQTELDALTRSATHQLLPDYTSAVPSPARFAAHELISNPSDWVVLPAQTQKPPIAAPVPLQRISYPPRSAVSTQGFSRIRATRSDVQMPSISPNNEPNFDADEFLFDFDGDAEAVVFRKSDAPRAMRAAATKPTT